MHCQFDISPLQINKIQMGPINLIKSLIDKYINDYEFIFLATCLALYGLVIYLTLLLGISVDKSLIPRGSIFLT